MDDLYLQHILEHAKHPHNYGEPKSFDLKKAGVNPSCGDEITLFVTFRKDETVKDIHFTGTGCAISVAATSLLIDQVKGMKKTEIIALSEQDINNLLNVDINPAREKCSLLGLHTLKNIILETP